MNLKINLARLSLSLAVALSIGAAFAFDPREEQYPTPNPPAPCCPTNVLSIANSFAHQLTLGETNLKRLADQLGHKVNHTVLFKENCNFYMHWSNRESVGYYTDVATAGGAGVPYIAKGLDESNVSLKSILELGQWDVVTIQSASESTWSKNEWTSFTNIVNLVRETNPNAKILMQQTWALGRSYGGCKEDGLPSIDGRDNYYEKVALNYQRAYYNSPQEIYGIIPVGYAVQKFYYTEPSITIDQEQFIIHPDDNKHLSHTGGTALQAMVWCKILFGDVPAVDKMPDTFVNRCGDKLALVRQCALAACEPDVSYFDYGRGTVDFRFPVVFKNYDGTIVNEQSVTNFACAVSPDITKLDVGEGYEATGWKSSPSAALMTPEKVEQTKVYGPITYTLNRKVVGETGPTRVWTGYVSTSWGEAQNWEPAVVPDEDSDVYIPYAKGVGTNQLVKLWSSATVNSLTIGTGDELGTAELMLCGKSGVLTVKGDLNIKTNATLSSYENGYVSSSTRLMRSYTGEYNVNVVANGNIVIDVGGKVDVTGKGYIYERGFKSAYTKDGTYTLGSLVQLSQLSWTICGFGRTSPTFDSRRTYSLTRTKPLASLTRSISKQTFMRQGLA